MTTIVQARTSIYNPLLAFGTLFRHRALIIQMARRELNDSYVGSMLGIFWATLHPLALMSVYIVVFSFVFQVRVSENGSALEYIIYLMTGLLPWLTCSNSMAKATIAITSDAGLVKQVVFPVEVLPAKSVIATLLAQMVGTAILLLLILVTGDTLPVTALLFPLLLVVQTLILIGIAWILAAIGTFFRDLKDVFQVFLLAIIYLLPIFYLPSSVPGPLLPLIQLNPFSHLLYTFQDAIFYGAIEHPWSWLVTIIFMLISLVGGYALFTRLRPYFGNVL